MLANTAQPTSPAIAITSAASPPSGSSGTQLAIES